MGRHRRPGRPRIHPRKRGPRESKITDIRKRVDEIENEIKQARGDYREKKRKIITFPGAEMPADLIKNLDDVDVALELLRVKIAKFERSGNGPDRVALINHTRDAINHAANMVKAVINCAQEGR